MKKPSRPSSQKKKPRKSLEPFDKYKYYIASVQCPESDVTFFEQVWRELRSGRKLITLREDFCGTFIVCCQWVKSKNGRKAIGVDIDHKPLAYGQKNHYAQLTEKQKKQIQICCSSVLSPRLPCADLIVASNFSYYLLQERKDLLKYFSLARKKLNKHGLFVIDCFGGSACHESNEDEVKHKGFSYFWDQSNFDPISHRSQLYIHFKRHGEKKRCKVFSYDWRMWTLPEIKDLLKDAGFKKIHVYWEGTTKDGEGDGHFKRVNKGEACEAWVAYIVSE